MFNRQYQKRRYEAPKNFPYVVTFRLGDGRNTDLQVKDLEAYNAFRRNVGLLDTGKITLRKQELGETPFTADDFAQSLKDGVEFHGELADDGNPVTCFRCSGTFTPKIIPSKKEEDGEYGNFLILKEEQFSDMADCLPEELRTRVTDNASATTNSIMFGQPVPSLAVALPICPQCRPERAKNREREHIFPAWERTFSRASAARALPTVDQNIGVARNKMAIAKALDLAGGRKLNRRPVGSGVGTERSDSGRYNRYDNRDGNKRQFERREDTRPRRQWPGPGGAELLIETANALDRYGYTSLEDAIAAAKSGKLLEQEIVPSPNALAAVANILSYAFQNQRQVVGSQQPSIVAPGVSRPQSQRRTAKPSRPPRVVINADPNSGLDRDKKTRRRNTGGTSPNEALG